jgi:hypothetical protein
MKQIRWSQFGAMVGPVVGAPIEYFHATANKTTHIKGKIAALDPADPLPIIYLQNVVRISGVSNGRPLSEDPTLRLNQYGHYVRAPFITDKQTVRFAINPPTKHIIDITIYLPGFVLEQERPFACGCHLYGQRIIRPQSDEGLEAWYNIWRRRGRSSCIITDHRDHLPDFNVTASHSSALAELWDSLHPHRAPT